MGAGIDSVEIGKIYVKVGNNVKKGDILFEIITMKANFDVEAEEEGKIVSLNLKEGEEIDVLKEVGVIENDYDLLNKKNKINESGEIKEKEENYSIDKKELRITPRARKMLEEKNIKISNINFNGNILKEKDVFEITKKKILDKGKINNDFLEWLENNKEYFSSISSEEKIKKYIENGAIIGKNVKIGKGSVILSKNIVIEDSVTIGNECYIKSDLLNIGKMVFLGDKVNAVVKEIILGDVLYTGRDILIGGGGAYGPDARFETGKNCFIGSECVINCGEEVKLGDHTCLSPRVQIFTHSHWQSVLDGFDAQFGRVFIGNNTHIGGNSLVTPNTSIGNDCFVLANSNVIFDIPDKTLVGGVPAKIIKKDFPRKLSLEQKDKIMRRLLDELIIHLKNQGIDVKKEELNEKISLKTNYKEKRIIYCLKAERGPIDADVILTFDSLGLNEKHSCIFDLTDSIIKGEQDNLTDEIRNFLRRRGIKFSPIYWRYSADKGLFNT